MICQFAEISRLTIHGWKTFARKSNVNYHNEQQIDIWLKFEVAIFNFIKDTFGDDDLDIWKSTCVSAFREILQSLQCKIFQYTFLRQYRMKIWDFFSLCKIPQLAWLYLDRIKLRPSEVRFWDPCIMKLENAFWCMVYCFENHLLGYLLNSKRINITFNIYILLIQVFKTLVWVEINKVLHDSGVEDRHLVAEFKNSRAEEADLKE